MWGEAKRRKRGVYCFKSDEALSFYRQNPDYLYKITRKLQFC